MLKASLVDQWLFSNKGDVAICEGTLNAFSALDIKPLLLMPFKPREWANLAHVYDVAIYSNLCEPILAGYFLLNSLKLKKISGLPHFNSDYLRRYFNSIRKLASSDILWLVGGMPYSNVKNVHGLIFGNSRLSFTLLAKKALNKPLIVGGISLGGDEGIYKYYGQYVIAQLLKNSSYIIIREPISYNIILKFKTQTKARKIPPISLGYDYAFNCMPNMSENSKRVVEKLENELDLSGGRKIVFLNLMPKISTSVSYEILRYLMDLKYSIVLYPNDEEDLLLCYKLLSELKGGFNDTRNVRISILNTMPYLASELYYILSLLNRRGLIAFGISCRSHGAIAFLTNLIPTLHLAYSHKGVGIMSMLGLEKYCLPLQLVNNDVLRRLILSLDKDNEPYKSFLENTIPDIRNKIVKQTRQAIIYCTEKQ